MTDEQVAEAIDRLRSIMDELPETSEGVTHGAITFHVRERRVLAALVDQRGSGDGLSLLAPAPPGVQEDVVASEPARFFRPADRGEEGWIGLRIDLAPNWREITEVIHDAYRLVAPRALVRQLDAELTTS